MRDRRIGKTLATAMLATLFAPICGHQAHASQEHGHVRAMRHVAPPNRTAFGYANHATSHAANHARGARSGHHAIANLGRHNAVHRREVAWSEGGISCVPFARGETGIEISGNASSWWDNAAGLYARGSRPESGSVLNFMANSHMRLGHVAAVRQVLDDRHLTIDHANWSGPGARRGGISRGITVVDVSPANDWTAVRVELGHSGVFGSVYPTYGFIYARSEGARNRYAGAAPMPRVMSIPTPSNPVLRDLHVVAMRAMATRVLRYDEVAQAPPARRRAGLDLRMPALAGTGGTLPLAGTGRTLR